MNIRIFAALAALMALQPAAAHADALDGMFPGCTRDGPHVTAWHCTADAFKDELAADNVNGGYPMTEDKPAPKHHQGRSKRNADR